MYLTVEMTNKGRTIFENGVMVSSHTKKSDLTKSPQKLWNQKGKKMIFNSRGAILEKYGLEGWELISTRFGESYENTYIFKKKMD